MVYSVIKLLNCNLLRRNKDVLSVRLERKLTGFLFVWRLKRVKDENFLRGLIKSPSDAFSEFDSLIILSVGLKIRK